MSWTQSQCMFTDVKVKVTKYCICWEELINVYERNKFDINIVYCLIETKQNTTVKSKLLMLYRQN